MKRLQIVGIVIGLFILSLAMVQIVSASPISPPSTGCQAANINSIIFGSGYSFPSNSFYDDDTLHISTSTPVNIHITSRLGVNYFVNNVTTINYSMLRTAQYTFTIIPANGAPFFLYLTCSSTPISGGCIVSKNYFSGSISLNLNYNAGERLHISAAAPVGVVIQELLPLYF